MGTSPKDQILKQKAHQAANEAVKQLRTTGQYFTAFIVSFALLEDRLRAMDYVARDLDLVSQVVRKRESREWKAIVDRLHEAAMFDKKLRDELLNLADMRNKVVHSAIYNLSSVNDKHVGRLLEARRVIDLAVRKLVRKKTGLLKNSPSPMA